MTKDGRLLIQPAGGARHAGRAMWRGRTLPCVLGRSGIRIDKREGDGATPGGIFGFRRVLYRADRLAKPMTALPIAPIGRDDGWCDDPVDPFYNKPVRLPFGTSHERLWRDDRLYDLILVIGHNDDPVIPGRGSAVFVHLARSDLGPTAGCVAFTSADLLSILKECGNNGAVHIEVAPS